MIKITVGFIINNIFSMVIFIFFPVNPWELYCFNIVPSGNLPATITVSDMQLAYNRLADIVSAGSLLEARQALHEIQVMHDDPR